MSEVNSKSIVITGGAAGIGLATAHLLHAKGWRVGLIDISEELLTHAKAELPGSEVATAVADVSDARSLSVAIDSLSEALGGIDAIFNNAGILQAGTFAELPLADHQLTVGVNATGVVNGCHLAIPHLRKRSGVKHIINMSSASTIHGVPGLSVYSATKAFVEHLSEAISIEEENSKITVSTVAVPFVQTAMIDVDAKAMNEYIKSQKKIIKPEDVADRVAAILDGSASSRLHQLISTSLTIQHILRRLLPSSVMHSAIKRLYRKASTD